MVAENLCCQSYLRRVGSVKKGAGFNECKGGNTVASALVTFGQAGLCLPDDVPVTKKAGKS